MFNSPKKIPVLLIIFNRPEKVSVLLKILREIKPEKIYVAADGPRENNPSDINKIKECKKLVDSIDWDCKINKNYSEKNLGLSERMESAIDWLFKNEEVGIIFEDDCVPHPDFFEFVNILLNYYKNNEEIMIISGSNFQDGKKRGDASYYFSRYGYIWGWATWKRAWLNYDKNLEHLPSFIENDSINELFGDPREQKQWIENFTNKYKDPYTKKERLTWATTWLFSMFNKKGIAIIPNVNLVQNIGFGDDSTHTRGRGKKHSIKSSGIQEIKHPQNIIIDKQADTYLFKRNHLSTNWKKLYNNLNVFLDKVKIKPIIIKILKYIER